MRYIVAGTSPHIADAPLSLFKDNPVIGVNQAYRIPLVNDHMDHWICWDSDERHQGNIKDWNQFVKPECKVYMRDDPDGVNKELQTSDRIIFYKGSIPEHSMHRKNIELMYLTMRGSVATTACGLASLLPAMHAVSPTPSMLGSPISIIGPGSGMVVFIKARPLSKSLPTTNPGTARLS